MLVLKSWVCGVSWIRLCYTVSVFVVHDVHNQARFCSLAGGDQYLAEFV